jgi:hypothetical protein
MRETGNERAASESVSGGMVPAVNLHKERTMLRKLKIHSFRAGMPVKALAGVLVMAGLVGCANSGSSASGAGAQPAMMVAAGNVHMSGPFHGVKANTGTVTHRTENGRQILSVSDDFKIPDTPAPSWQVVDSSGNVYLLNQFRIKDNRTNRTVTLPVYIKDVSKVQVWCTFAEVLLGEAEFESPVR